MDKQLKEKMLAELHKFGESIGNIPTELVGEIAETVTDDFQKHLAHLGVSSIEGDGKGVEQALRNLAPYGAAMVQLRLLRLAREIQIEES